MPDLYAPVRAELAAARRLFDAELHSELPFINELCDVVRSYRGKMLRPAMLLLSGKAVGRLSAAHTTLAAVIEMIHVATLVHDDVLDEADERRARPTVRSVEGNVCAVLLGDYLISHAFHLCSQLDSSYACRRVGAATNTVCEGELLQNHLRGGAQVSEADYLGIIRRKTAALTGVACELGAYYADADSSLVHAMRHFGTTCGVAFQITDDVLDVIGDERQVGKTLGLDLARGTVTLPAIHCLTNAGSETRALLRAALLGEQPTDNGRLREWLTETGSVDYAIGVARRFVSEALHQLDGVPQGPATQSLREMAEFILERRC